MINRTTLLFLAFASIIAYGIVCYVECENYVLEHDYAFGVGDKVRLGNTDVIIYMHGFVDSKDQVGLVDFLRFRYHESYVVIFPNSNTMLTVNKEQLKAI